MAKILVVEDNKTSLLVLTEVLTKGGYEVVGAPTAVKALQMLEEGEEAPDLIVSDVMMAYMDGLEFAEKIRADSRLKDIPIVMCTALADRKTVMRAAKLGVRNYIVKPLEGKKVLEEVKAALALAVKD